jgi:dGTPase
VREGIVKHSRDFEQGENPALDEYLPGLRPLLEAQLIDLADEIAYNTADLDDAFSGGFFSVADVDAAVPQYGAVYADVEMQFPGAPERIRFNEALRRLIDLLMTGLIEGTRLAIEASGVRTVEDVRRHPVRLVELLPAAAETDAALKRFLHSSVYFSDLLIEERHRSTEMIAGLFQHFLEHPESLPETYQEPPCPEPLHRLVCDYIAGMTDGFCRRTYHQIFR